jgi:two-component system response regulator AtoC
MSLGSILVVEDDPVTCETFRDILEGKGYDVTLAGNADAGLAAVESRPPCGILLDLRMPLVDGLAFLRRLRASPSHAGIPVAVVTGDYLIDEELANDINRQGARIYFKPLWDDDVLDVVGQLLSGVAAPAT